MHTLDDYTPKNSKKLQKTLKNTEQLPYDKNPREDMGQQEIINESRQWMTDYIKSDKYRELLTKEVEINNQIIFKDWNESYDFENLLSFHGFSWTTKEIVDKMIQQRLYNVEATTTELVDQWPWNETYVWQTETGIKIKGWNTTKIQNHINLEEDLFHNESRPSAATHEFTHASTANNYLLIPLTILELWLSTNSTNKYFSNTTEIHARMTEIKYLLWKTKICDPFRDEITKEHIDELAKYDFMQEWTNRRYFFWDSKKSTPLGELLNESEIDKQDLINLMNEIASNKKHWGWGGEREIKYTV